MRALLRKQVSILSDRSPIDLLVLQIGRLVRQRGYARANVVSAMLLKYLPPDAGYDWSGEAALHARLTKADLDTTTMGHLTASARLELANIQERGRS